MSFVDTLVVKPVLYGLAIACAVLLATSIGLWLALVWRGNTLATVRADLRAANSATDRCADANERQTTLIERMDDELRDLRLTRLFEGAQVRSQLTERSSDASDRDKQLQADRGEVARAVDATGCADSPIGAAMEKAVRR